MRIGLGDGGVDPLSNGGDSESDANLARDALEVPVIAGQAMAHVVDGDPFKKHG